MAETKLDLAKALKDMTGPEILAWGCKSLAEGAIGGLSGFVITSVLARMFPELASRGITSEEFAKICMRQFSTALVEHEILNISGRIAGMQDLLRQYHNNEQFFILENLTTESSYILGHLAALDSRSCLKPYFLAAGIKLAVQRTKQHFWANSADPQDKARAVREQANIVDTIRDTVNVTRKLIEYWHGYFDAVTPPQRPYSCNALPLKPFDELKNSRSATVEFARTLGRIQGTDDTTYISYASCGPRFEDRITSELIRLLANECYYEDFLSYYRAEVPAGVGTPYLESYAADANLENAHYHVYLNYINSKVCQINSRFSYAPLDADVGRGLYWQTQVIDYNNPNLKWSIEEVGQHGFVQIVPLIASDKALYAVLDSGRLLLMPRNTSEANQLWRLVFHRGFATICSADRLRPIHMNWGATRLPVGS